MSSKFYISGPMKGFEDKNYPFFENVCITLRESGYTIVSPHESPFQDNYVNYMKVDITELMKCDAIVMLPGWVYSNGAICELAVARGLKMPVYFYNRYAELKSQLLLEMGTPLE